MKTFVPSQKLVVQVNPMKVVWLSWDPRWCRQCVCRLLYVDDHQVVVLEHSLSFQLGLCVHIILGIIGGLKH